MSERIEVRHARLTEKVGALARELVEANERTRTAMRHLGNVLQMLAELHEDERCRAFDEAMAFYNERNLGAPVVPEPGYSIRLRISSPLSRAIDETPPEITGARGRP